MDTTSQKRDRLYNAAMIVSLVFGIVLAISVTLYKLNEDYLNENARFQKLMESVNSVHTRDDVELAPKVNIKVNFSDGGDRSLVIPLASPIDSQKVSIHEEFTQNKYVISLAGYGENILGEINLIGDLDITNAAGAYTQNGNVVVEAYCNGVYGYDIMVDETAVTVYFYDVDTRYNYKAVVWTPYSDENLAGFSDFGEELVQFAQENGIRLYVSCNLENEYSQEDIVDFSNRIDADMVIGLDVEKNEDSNAYMMGICNCSYFIPNFDSTRLAICLVDGFMGSFDYEVKEFEQEGGNMPLVCNAVVPAAVIRLSVPEMENEYILTENLIEGMEFTINNALAEWRQGNESQ